VRETWYNDSPNETSGAAQDYRATHNCRSYEAGCPCNPDGDGKRSAWRPSIHMPRWASRITLEVVSVRVERLRAITEEDARAEGVDWVAPHPYGERWDDDREDPREVGYPGGGSFARDNFRRLWDSINGKRAAWAQNPWVWAVEFRMVQP
jgi:hypothetical protein